MAVFRFLGYCFTCMLDCFSCTMGHVPKGFTMKDGLVGMATFLILLIIVFLILWATGIIKFKK